MKRAHVDRGTKYARDVIAGKIPACKWVRQACDRHFRDLERAKAKDWPYRFDVALADRKIKFLELFPHTKGRWAANNEPFVAQPFQCFLTMSIFGWVEKATGFRRFREAMVLLPRKNGKSDWAARVGLLMLADDGEFGAEVYSGATTEKQAKEVFTPAHRMASRTPEFREFYGVEVMASNLHIPGNGSKFEPVIGKPGDGASPSCAIVDEYHEHLDDTLYDTMKTGMGARTQPLMLVITTAGDNMAGPCYALQKELEKVLDGVVENDRLFGMVYTIDVDDDWTSELALRKANPNYDVSVSGEFLRAAQQDAIRSARKQGIFKTKHGNVWVGARNAFFNSQAWAKCADSSIRPEDFRGNPLYVGLDLSSAIDISAVTLVFALPDDRLAVFGRSYIPESRVEAGASEHYRGWAAQGHLIATEGDRIDFNRIEEDILELHRDFGISEVAFDPAYAQQMTQRLMQQGLVCVEVRPTTMNFSAPMKMLDAQILAGELQHDGNPANAWMMANVVSREDNRGNVYPVKEKGEAKIDFAVSLIMANARRMAASLSAGAWTIEDEDAKPEQRPRGVERESEDDFIPVGAW